MTSARLPPAEFYATLPRSIAGAGVLFHDPDDRVLLVQPSYRTDTWLIPGGHMEAGEYPWETARREIKEELGLDLRPGRLLAVDWVPPQDDGRPALVNFVFDGGTLTAHDAEHRLHLQADELTAWRLCTPTECDQLLAPYMAQRIHACADALRTGRTAYLQHGRPPATTTD
ncbi:NUDIX domain-containing protein [Protofrankia symbiont of Coriaria ruscifolia]|uniref:NUDIX hydrolase n=1 Tax=Candidatus Protofrankia californiensis TaxID=1839754 RepID=A0A1C3NSP7_9ACTN|nr:NUDIX hydrolase [Protofrankia symbiont of Coriaria ruscifolia]SBW16977.1 NUDIX hydrolase [Candidatus Protofrankia californiensis]